MIAPYPIAALLDAPAAFAFARALLTLPYWSSGIAKLFDLDSARAEARRFRLEPVGAVVAATIAVQLGGSLLVISGQAAWLGAGALGVFTAAATLIAHPFWKIADPAERALARNTFLEHAGLIGGLMLVAILAEQEH